MSGRAPAQHKAVIGLLGGIGSGKSRVANLLADRGGRLLSGDEIGHAALRQPDLKARIVTRFGPTILSEPSEQGEIQRKVLGKLVFAEPQARRDLEAIVFPWIEANLRAHLADAQRDPAVRFIVLDAAIMLEAGWSKVVDWLVFVDTPWEQRVERVRSRGWDEAELRRREAAQMSVDEKKRCAQIVLDNSGTLAQLADQVERILPTLLGTARPQATKQTSQEPQ